jgi:TRAP-type C4-dicarboxylate transport system substrate-binding protein
MKQAEEETMRLSLSRRVAALALVAALAGLAAPAAAQTTLLLGESEALNSPIDQMGQRFVELINEKGKGAIRVNFVRGQSLGSAQQVMEQQMQGAVDMMTTRLDWLAPYSKDFQILTWGFTFRDRDHMQKFLDGDLFKQMADTVQQQSGVKLLAAAVDQPRILFSTMPVKSLTDIKDIKMRVPQLKAYLALWESLGTRPTQVAWAEAFLALKTGVVAAAEADAPGAFSQKFQVAAPHITRTDHLMATFALTMNQKRFSALKPEEQKIITEAARETVKWASDNAVKAIDEVLGKMKAEGATVSDIDRKPFMERARTVVPQMEKDGLWSPGLWDKIQSIQ